MGSPLMMGAAGNSFGVNEGFGTMIGFFVSAVVLTPGELALLGGDI